MHKNISQCWNISLTEIQEKKKRRKEGRREDKLREGGEGRKKRKIRRKCQQSEFALLTGVAGKSMDFRLYNWAAPSCHHFFWDWAICWLPRETWFLQPQHSGCEGKQVDSWPRTQWALQIKKQGTDPSACGAETFDNLMENSEIWFLSQNT